ncbi:DUF6779 domain-containing protein [Mycobacterium sp. ML4]
MTVLSRGARVRRGGRRPGWVLLTTLLVLAIGASSALVFTDRVELLKLAVILALWAAVAGAFVSVLYRRQAEADQARARDMKLVYDLQLDREISARREYELTVESQLRRELAAELRAQAADEIAALRAELSALRTNLEILFDTDLEHRPALENLRRDAARALTDRPASGATNGESLPVDWVASDRVTAVRQEQTPDETPLREEEVAIIDVPEEPLLPPRQPAQVREYPPAPQPEQFQPRHRPPPPPPHFQPPPQSQPPPAARQPVAADGQWLPPGAPGSHWARADAPAAQVPREREGRGRRSRHANVDEPVAGPIGLPEEVAPPQYGGRRSRSRHSAEYRDYGVGNFSGNSSGAPLRSRDSQPEPRPPASEPPAPPRLAPAPPPPPAPRHRSAEEPVGSQEDTETPSGGQSAAELLARFQVQPSGGGRRRRRDA